MNEENLIVLREQDLAVIGKIVGYASQAIADETARKIVQQQGHNVFQEQQQPLLPTPAPSRPLLLPTPVETAYPDPHPSLMPPKTVQWEPPTPKTFANPPLKSASASPVNRVLLLMNRLGPSKRVVLFGLMGAMAVLFGYLSFTVAVGFLGGKEEQEDVVEPPVEEVAPPAEEAPAEATPAVEAPKIPSFPALPTGP